jgi:hypothetical protein
VQQKRHGVASPSQLTAQPLEAPVRIFRSFLNLRLASLALPLVAVTALPACDLFNSAKASVQQAAQIPLDVNEATKISLDVGKLTGPTAGTVTPIDMNQDLTTPPAPIDLNKSQPDLAKYANGHIVTVEINKIGVTPTTNTLTSDLPSLDLYIGPTTAKGIADCIKVATIPKIAKGSTTAVDAVIDAAAMKEAGTKYMATLAFAQMLSGKLVIKAGDTVPGGKIDLNLDLGVHAVVSPL